MKVNIDREKFLVMKNVIPLLTPGKPEMEIYLSSYDHNPARVELDRGETLNLFCAVTGRLCARIEVLRDGTFLILVDGSVVAKIAKDELPGINGFSDLMKARMSNPQRFDPLAKMTGQE